MGKLGENVGLASFLVLATLCGLAAKGYFMSEERCNSFSADAGISWGDCVINGYTLKLTCAVCPEQYDVFNPNNVQVGYLRLRHGYFRADCPDVGGDVVYEAHTRGDGCFDSDERMPQLTAAVNSIDAYWKKNMETLNT